MVNSLVIFDQNIRNLILYNCKSIPMFRNNLIILSPEIENWS